MSDEKKLKLPHKYSADQVRAAANEGVQSAMVLMKHAAVMGIGGFGLYELVTDATGESPMLHGLMAYAFYAAAFLHGVALLRILFSWLMFVSAKKRE